MPIEEAQSFTLTAAARPFFARGTPYGKGEEHFPRQVFPQRGRKGVDEKYRFIALSIIAFVSISLCLFTDRIIQRLNAIYRKTGKKTARNVSKIFQRVFQIPSDVLRNSSNVFPKTPDVFYEALTGVIRENTAIE